MPAYQIKNWDKYQHYKHRGPPWIKLHYEIFTSSDWVMLADASRLLAVVCMLVASRHDGFLPASITPAYLKRLAYLDHTPNLKPLVESGFLVEVLATASMRKQLRTNADTESESESEREKEKKEAKKDSGNGHLVFESGVIRLNEKDFNRWKDCFPLLDLKAELVGITDWAEKQPKWYPAVQGLLAKKNRDEKRKRETRDTKKPSDWKESLGWT